MTFREKLHNIVAAQRNTCDNPEFTSEIDHRLHKKSLLKKCGVSVIRSAVAQYPDATNAFLFGKYQRNGFYPIGAGTQVTAVFDGSEVIKIDRKSAKMTEAERQNHAASLIDLIAENRDAHGETSVETRVSIGNDPVDLQPRVVLLHQPLVDKDETLADDSRTQLAEFADRSLARMKPRGVLPDVYGTENVFFSSGILRLVDTVALPETDKGFNLQEQILSRWQSNAEQVK